MENRVKNKLEYLFHCSPKLLYRFISSPSGFEEWFADRVNVHNEVYEFYWDESSNKALLIENKINSHCRMRWMEADEEEFFEFRIRQDELTGEVSLTITDFCDANDLEDNQMLWDQSVQQLRSRIGA
jgi:hypothetical protein